VIHRRLALLAFCILHSAFCISARAAHVAFVDNRAPAGGIGSAESPFHSIDLAARSADVVFVMETADPYVESFSLKKGQMLIGSAVGLDAIRVDKQLVLDASAPAAQGPGPLIQGTISVEGNNLIAGVRIAPPRGYVGIQSVDAMGTLEIRDVRFQTAQSSYAMFLQRQHGAITVTGGALDATNEGNGIVISGGDGNVVFDRFPISGSFVSALRLDDRASVMFRNGSTIRIDDASGDAIALASLKQITFADRMQVHGRRRGLVVNNVAKVVVSGEHSSLESIGSTALEMHDAGGALAFESVSSSGAAEGVIIDKLRGRLDIQSGTITSARNYGIRAVQSSNIHLANITITGSGSAGAIKGAKCAGEFDVNTTAPCNAALYLRHLQQSSFENIIVDSGGAIGINANNVRDLTFDKIEVRHAGDESFEAGVLVQETSGLVRMSNCRFTDNAGSQLRIEQRFNTGRVVLDHCELAAGERPQGGQRLLDLRSVGQSRLDVVMTNGSLHDNAGSAIDLSAAGSSALQFTIDDTNATHLGIGAINALAKEGSSIVLAMHRTQILAPAVNDKALVELAAADHASLCIDSAANTLTGGTAPLHMAGQGGGSTLRAASGTDLPLPAEVKPVESCN